MTHPLANVLYRKGYLLSIEMVLKGVRLELKVLYYASNIPATACAMARCPSVRLLHERIGQSKPDDPPSTNQGPDLQNILRFIVRLSLVYRKIDLR